MTFLKEIFKRKPATVPEGPVEPIDLSHFNRSQRRNGLFVIQNKVNGNYVKMTTFESGEVKFQAVPLKKCSYWMFENVKSVVYLMQTNKSGLNLVVRCYDHKLGRIIE